jgi:hypothetical protein
MTVREDCDHYFLTAGGTHQRCMLGRVPEFDCCLCPAYRPIMADEDFDSHQIGELDDE